MPILTAADHALSEIQNLADAVRCKLTVMRHAGPAKRDFAGLRETLQAYADKVMEFAHGTEMR